MDERSDDSPVAAACLIGGRYHVLTHLASGGMSEVHLARVLGAAGFERYVILKRIRAERADQPRAVSMLLEEARLTAQFHHQNIAQVFDVAQDGGDYVLAMEYVDGADLRTMLQTISRRGIAMPLEHALTIALGAAAGLHYAHEKRSADGHLLGVVHLDVSPANLMVAFDGAVKLIDFGIARTISVDAGAERQLVRGKPRYMSPEQCQGLALDRRSDVFSLGVVLYEMTTMTRLFAGRGLHGSSRRRVAGVIPAPSSRWPRYPRRLERVVMRCLAPDPADRWRTAGELAEQLEAFARDRGLVTSAAALGRYVHDLLGDRREPLVARPPEPPIELTTASLRPLSPGAREAATAIDVRAGQRSPRRWMWLLAVLGPVWWLVARHVGC